MIGKFLRSMVCVVGLAVTVGACGPMVPVVKLDLETRRALKDNVLLVKSADLQTGEFQQLQEVKATSCQNKTYEPAASVSDARDQLRHFAEQAGGNAVVDSVCTGVNSVDYGRNCWTWAECSGTAALLDDQAFAALRPAETEPAASRVARPAPPPAGLPERPVAVTFRKAAVNPDDIAVIIGNADYGKLAKDIPNVTPAYADAEGFLRFAREGLGIREGNIIHLRDATGSQLRRVFGTESDHKGQLFDWVRPDRSRVYVYYAGHGAPAVDSGTAYLVPSDADSARINLNGYPLSLLYANLAKLPVRSVTVVLEACFSGAAQSGVVIAKASPVYIKPKAPPVPDNLTVIAAGAPDQLASWEEDSAHSLFTTYYLKAMAGEADAAPYGDGDGTVALPELEAYLKDTLTYYARRYYGRDQTARIVVGGGG